MNKHFARTTFTAALLCSALAPALGVAADDYKTIRAKFQHQADRCDLINIQDVVQIQATPIKELKKKQNDTVKFLAKTKELRQNCYEQTKELLSDVMAAGLAESTKNPNDTTLTLQLELDEQLPTLLDMRQKISAELLDSMAADVKDTIKNERKYSRKVKGDLYVQESARTASLIKQDMGLVLGAEGRQLQLDELLTPPTKENTEAFVKLKLKKGMHHIARALMIYEDIQSKDRLVPVVLAKLRSEYLYAAGQLNELAAMDPELKSFNEDIRPAMQQLLNRAQLLELDIEGALRDFRNNAMEEDLDNWLSELYQDLSQLSLALKTQLQWFGVEQVVSTDEDLPDLPADLEAFIKKAEKVGEAEQAAEDAAEKAKKQKDDAPKDDAPQEPKKN